jgi:hypothetical protein
VARKQVHLPCKAAGERRELWAGQDRYGWAGLGRRAVHQGLRRGPSDVSTYVLDGKYDYVSIHDIFTNGRRHSNWQCCCSWIMMERGGPGENTAHHHSRLCPRFRFRPHPPSTRFRRGLCLPTGVPALLLTNDLDIKLFSSTGVVIPHGISLDVPGKCFCGMWLGRGEIMPLLLRS